MATAGSIVVDLLMKTGSFETDAKRATQRLKEIEKAAEQWGKRIGVAAAVAGTAFAAWTVKVGKMGVEIENLSRIAGASTDAFQRMAYGAKTYGIEQDKLSDQLKDFNEKVGEYIQSGGGGMKDFFEQIAPKVGVTADQFRRLSGPEGLQLYYDSLDKAGLNQKQMSFYLEAMASDTTALIPLLQNGGAEMKRLGDEADRLGVVMDEEAIRSAKEFDRNLDQLNKTTKGLAISLTKDLIPAINDVALSLVAARDSSFFGWLITSGADAKNAEAEILDLEKSLKGMRSTLKTFEDVGSTNAIARWWNADDVAILEAQIAATEKKISFLKSLVSLNPGVPPVLSTTEDEDKKDKDKKGGGSARKAKVDKDPLGTFITAQNIDFAMDQYQSYLDFVDEITGRTARQQISQQQNWLSDALTLGEISTQEFESAMDQLAKKSQGTMSQIDEFTLQAARNIQDSLGDGLYSLLSGNFDDIGAKFGDMVMRMAADAAAANIAGALFGDYGKTGQIGGLLGGLFSGTGLAEMAGNAAGMFGGDQIGAMISVLPGVSEGGYTGDGGRFDPAGIVHKGEGVLNQDEIRAIGGESGFNALRRAIRGRGNAIGGMGGRPSLPPSMAAGGAPQPAALKVEITNRSGTPLRAQDAGIRFDPREMVVSVFLDDVQRNGPIAQALKGGGLR